MNVSGCDCPFESILTGPPINITSCLQCAPGFSGLFCTAGTPPRLFFFLPFFSPPTAPSNISFRKVAWGFVEMACVMQVSWKTVLLVLLTVQVQPVVIFICFPPPLLFSLFITVLHFFSDICGDGVCNGNETCQSCFADCHTTCGKDTIIHVQYCTWGRRRGKKATN
jgi:hypothetical protein